MSIDLTPAQQEVIRLAIQSGWVRSVEEFINVAQGTLSRRENGLDKAKARLAGERIHELRKASP